MSLAQIGVILSMQGFVVLGLELPTGGVADAIGRRPVLLAASVVALGSGLIYVTAHTFGAFVVALLLQGLFRALDSGPLEAWYVDTAHADDPEVTVETTLTHAGTALGISIAVGALVSGGLVSWNPVPSMTALELPYWVALGFYAVNIVVIAVRMKETRSHLDSAGLGRALRSAREAPRTVVDGLRLMSSSRVLRSLLLVEVFWSVGMIAFEVLFPIRLSELAGGKTRAGALMDELDGGRRLLHARPARPGPVRRAREHRAGHRRGRRLQHHRRRPLPSRDPPGARGPGDGDDVEEACTNRGHLDDRFQGVGRRVAPQ